LVWINARCPPKPLYHSLSSAGQGRRKYDERLEGQDKDRRDHSLITVMDETD